MNTMANSVDPGQTGLSKSTLFARILSQYLKLRGLQKEHFLSVVFCSVAVALEMIIAGNMSPFISFLIYWPGLEVIKLFFMLNSIEHEIFPAHKC